MKVAVIRNPVAGGMGSRLRWAAVEASLRRAFPTFELLETLGVGDAIGISRDLSTRGYDLIIAVGGDGTISETAAGILSSARPETPLSFVPLGSASDFSRNFQLPSDLDAVVSCIAAAVPQPVDAAVLVRRAQGLPDRAFVNIASIGISGDIVRAANSGRVSRLAGATLHFLYHSVCHILRYKPHRVRVVADGSEIFRGPVISVVCANGAWFGGGMRVVPMAELDDGLLHVGILRFTGRWALFRLMMKFYDAGHVSHPQVSFHTARSIEITTEGSVPAAIEADGEDVGEGILSAEIRPAALWLRI